MWACTSQLLSAAHQGRNRKALCCLRCLVLNLMSTNTKDLSLIKAGVSHPQAKNHLTDLIMRWVLLKVPQQPCRVTSADFSASEQMLSFPRVVKGHPSIVTAGVPEDNKMRCEGGVFHHHVSAYEASLSCNTFLGRKNN